MKKPCPYPKERDEWLKKTGYSVCVWCGPWNCVYPFRIATPDELKEWAAQRLKELDEEERMIVAAK